MEAIEAKLEAIEQLMITSFKEVLNVREASLYLGISEDRLRHMISHREVPHYKKGKKVFFAKAELNKWMLADRVMTQEEIEAEADTYIACKMIQKLGRK